MRSRSYRMISKKTITLLSVVILLLGFFLVSYRSSGKNSTTHTGKELAISLAVAPTEEKVQELHFTEEQLQSYYTSYTNPFVLHIRKAFVNYLAGKNEGIELLAIPPDKAEDGTIAGLDSFSKDYYKSKFIVFGINDSVAGGKEINIIFQDKQDRLFNVWIYKLADDSYELRGFWQNKNFTEKEMQKIQKQYGVYLHDRKHAL